MSSDKEATFHHFGKNFQDKLVELILNDSQFANQIGEVLDVGFFESKYQQVFAKMIYDYRDKYKKYPSESTIQSILKTGLKDESPAVVTKLKEFYVRIAKKEINGVDVEYVKDKSLDFCRKQKLKDALIKSTDLLERSSFEEVSKVINDAIKLGAANDAGYDYLLQFEERYQFKARKPVSTGWPVMDDFMQGGLGRGELGVVIASTGSGKSMCLVALGAAAVKAGKKVIHYTLELSDKVIGLRYDSCITGNALNDLKFLKDDTEEQLQKIEGSLIIKEYPTKSASTETIRNHLEKLKMRGFEPDMIIVDYGDLLKPISFFKEKRESLETIYEDLRGIASEQQCPVWTASQTNRTGVNAEVVTMESISEAFSKCFVADFIFSAARTMADKQTNQGRFFIAKNRMGEDGIVCPIFMDTSCVDIKVFEPTGESIDEIEDAVEKNLVKVQKKFVSERYNDYKKKKKNGDIK